MKALYLKYKPHYNDTLKLAIPVVISQVGHIAVHLSDSIVVGHFAGTVSLAAVSLVGSLFIVPMLMVWVYHTALHPLFRRKTGGITMPSAAAC